MWGLTGAGFEFHWVNTARYAVTGGHNTESPTFTSAKVKDSKTSDITVDAAIAAGQAKAGPGARLKNISLPTADDPTATYSLYFARGFDAWRYSGYPGQFGVNVDRHNAANLDVDDLGTAPTASNKLLDSWGAPLFHYGQSVNGAWRLVWFVFGLAPVALAVTGLSTWLFKRKVRKRRDGTGRRNAAGELAVIDAAT